MVEIAGNPAIKARYRNSPTRSIWEIPLNALYGAPGGIAAAGNQLWHQDSPGIGGAVEANDRFGDSLACSPRAKLSVYLPLVVRAP